MCPDGSLTPGQRGQDHRTAMKTRCRAPRPIPPARTTLRTPVVAAPAVAVVALVATGCQTTIGRRRGRRAGDPGRVRDLRRRAPGHRPSGPGSRGCSGPSTGCATRPVGLGRSPGRRHRLPRRAVRRGATPRSSASAPRTSTATALFGVDASDLFDVPDSVPSPNGTTTRATQSVGDVPVLDATRPSSGRGLMRQHRGPRAQRRPRPGLSRARRPRPTPR